MLAPLSPRTKGGEIDRRTNLFLALLKETAPEIVTEAVSVGNCVDATLKLALTTVRQ
jgi:hypothetical protein